MRERVWYNKEEVIHLKNIILVKNLSNEESKKKIMAALSETRLEYEVNLEKGCVIIEGNYDMVLVAKRVLSELGFTIL